MPSNHAINALKDELQFLNYNIIRCFNRAMGEGTPKCTCKDRATCRTQRDDNATNRDEVAVAIRTLTNLTLNPSLDEANGIQWFGLNTEVTRLPSPSEVFLLTRTQDNRKVAVTESLFNAMQAFRDNGGLDSTLTRQNRRVRTEDLS